MTITFYLIVLNHHQVFLADELYKRLGEGFSFVELGKQRENKGGTEDYSSRPYLIRDWYDEEQHRKALSLLASSDVCVFGGAESRAYSKARIKKGLLTFMISERWLKKGIVNLFSPRLFPQFLSYQIHSQDKKVVMLCASAYASHDFERLRMFRDRCFKWGYFTNVPELDIERIIETRELNIRSRPFKIMWCSRFLRWKHPELPILLASYLRSKSFSFRIDMFGTGPEENACLTLRERYQLEEYISFRGEQPNDQIIQEMRAHDLFLFTSDNNEGWGAVLNEAMSNGCPVVASDAIGAVPYLINSGYNGISFHSNSLDSLAEAVISLMESPRLRCKLAINAYRTMKETWSPYNAAKSITKLAGHFMEGEDEIEVSGPCSRA